jgi:hypothetical protein
MLLHVTCVGGGEGAGSIGKTDSGEINNGIIFEIHGEPTNLFRRGRMVF